MGAVSTTPSQSIGAHNEAIKTKGPVTNHKVLRQRLRNQSVHKMKLNHKVRIKLTEQLDQMRTKHAEVVFEQQMKDAGHADYLDQLRVKLAKQEKEMNQRAKKLKALRSQVKEHQVEYDNAIKIANGLHIKLKKKSQELEKATSKTGLRDRLEREGSHLRRAEQQREAALKQQEHELIRQRHEVYTKQDIELKKKDLIIASLEATIVKLRENNVEVRKLHNEICCAGKATINNQKNAIIKKDAIIKNQKDAAIDAKQRLRTTIK